MKLIRIAAFAAALSCLAAQAAVPLPKYNVDKTQATVSGLSAGGFMASQLGYAYSSYFRGVGIFAAGPYMCAGHNNYTACMYNASISSAQLATMQNSLDSFSASGAIDNKSNVASQKIFMFVGASDTTVGPNPMNAARTQYTNNGVSAANLEFVNRASTAHVFPTDFDSTGNNACGTTASPYISNCGYDGAKAVLSKFYGTLNARNNAPAAGNYIEFDQRAFTGNAGMAPTGWVYVPANCASGTQCKVHVALHGCVQSYGNVGDKFIKNSGYTRWADTNSIIVLFPQAQVDNTSRQTAASGSLPNPNACSTGSAGTAATSRRRPARRWPPSRRWWTSCPPAAARRRRRAAGTDQRDGLGCHHNSMKISWSAVDRRRQLQRVPQRQQGQCAGRHRHQLSPTPA
jgi:poly(3-hydroxybutyrate) depolymerase